jgi:ABC-type sugar transport system substrate-binding protein
MMKKILSVLICVLLIAFMFAGCASKTEEPETSDSTTTALTGKDVYTEDIKLAFIPISTAGITNQMYNTAIAECLSMYPNVTLNVFDGQYDVTVINNDIQECITQGYDAIILEPFDTEAHNSAVADAENAGIPVLTINGGNPSGLHSYHIQGADYEMGQQGAQHLTEACGNTGNVIILDAPAASVASARMGTALRNTSITTPK